MNDKEKWLSQLDDALGTALSVLNDMEAILPYRHDAILVLAAATRTLSRAYDVLEEYKE
jgi:hypothetical protein